MKSEKMKRLFVFVPGLLVGLFLLNSFAQKETAKVFSNNTWPANVILKSTDAGKTWKEIRETLPDIERSTSSTNIIKAEGVLIAKGEKGIKRSTDNGKHWQWVISEGGVGIAVELIKGGFAAITYNTKTKSRRIRMSLDNGKTWQSIDEGLPPSSLISSIKQMGKYLICGHPAGIYRSSDRGKTWNRVLCGVEEKEFKFSQTWDSRSTAPKHVYSIHVSGNVLYALAVPVGC